MRKRWFAAYVAIIMAAGCAGSATPTQPIGAHSPAVTTGAKASWAERIKAPLKSTTAALDKLKPSQRPKPPHIEPAFDPADATPELYVHLAQMSHRSGNVPQARQLYQKALAKDPNHLDALLGAARMEDREGQLDVALMLYQRAAAAHPRSAMTLNDLALCHARRGELPTAHQALEQAVRLEPQKPLYRNNVAKVLVELNSLAPAMQHLAAAHPPAVANYNMAVLLSERGRIEESSQYLSQAIAINPQFEQARAMLAQQTAPPASGHGQYMPSLAQQAPAASARGATTSTESILPTPAIVATIPWQPAGAATPSPYPSTSSAGLAPTPSPGTTAQEPALLPPVNQSN